MSERSNSRPVRVVHLIGQLGRGGTEHQLYLLLKHLDPARIRSAVVVFNPSPHAVYDEPLRRLGVAVDSVPAERRSPVRRIPWLRQRIAAFEADVVHSWTVHDNLYAALCGRLAGVPVRWGSLRGSPDSATLTRLPWLLRRLTLAAPQRLVVNTPRLVEELRERGRPAETLSLLPNCVEDREPAETEPADLPDLPFSPDTRLVGSIGNLRAVKNHRMFIGALAAVLPERPGVGAVIVGQPLPTEPDLPGRLRRQIEAAGLGDRVVLTGFRDDVPAILRRLSVLCLSSRTEGTPNVLLEAMMAGCPVVATSVGGIPDLVHHAETGLLVPSDDEAALAEAIRDLLDHPERAKALAREARRVVRTRHGCRAIADRLAQLYEEAVPAASRRGGP